MLDHKISRRNSIAHIFAPGRYNGMLGHIGGKILCPGRYTEMFGHRRTLDNSELHIYAKIGLMFGHWDIDFQSIRYNVTRLSKPTMLKIPNQEKRILLQLDRRVVRPVLRHSRPGPEVERNHTMPGKSP